MKSIKSSPTPEAAACEAWVFANRAPNLPFALAFFLLLFDGVFVLVTCTEGVVFGKVDIDFNCLDLVQAVGLKLYVDIRVFSEQVPQVKTIVFGRFNASNFGLPFFLLSSWILSLRVASHPIVITVPHAPHASPFCKSESSIFESNMSALCRIIKYLEVAGAVVASRWEVSFKKRRRDDSSGDSMFVIASLKLANVCLG